MERNGFTVMEVLIAVFILAIIMSIVYASFANVTRTLEEVRVGEEEIRLRRFLSHEFERNISAAYADRRVEQEAFRFLGIDDEGPDGPRDSVRFVSTAMLVGGGGFPGDIKEVRYSVAGDGEDPFGYEGDNADGTESIGPGRLEEGQPARELLAVETPFLGANVQEIEPELNTFVPDPNYEPPVWRAPIQTFDIRYYDGMDWVDEWDSTDAGRLPWSVHIRINFARTGDDGMQRGLEDLEESADFEMMIPVPRGLGMMEDARVVEDALTQMEAAETLQSEDEAPVNQRGEPAGDPKQ